MNEASKKFFIEYWIEVALEHRKSGRFDLARFCEEQLHSIVTREEHNAYVGLL